MNKTDGSDGVLYLGIDGGGSKCRAVLVNGYNNVLGEGVSGPANPLRGMDVATASVLDAAQQALEQASLPQSALSQLIVGAGLAGVNLPYYYRQFMQWQHPFAALHLTTDLHIACLGAHGGEDGAVIICGTGSCGLASVNGQLLEIGGHGFPFGDNGSGAWFGLQMLHHVLRSLDGLAPATIMTAALQQAVGQQSTLDLAAYFMNASPTTYAKYAPLVFRCAVAGDITARQIVEQGAAYINEIAQRLLQLQPSRLSLIGGVSEQLQPYLSDDIRAVIRPALQLPEFGAVSFARVHQSEKKSIKP
ncbi:BadF/BadG/BcrA/BcrD ATPase family protein [Chromatiaceae bacterium AAb-1]|nr:BadF/BadG/BcrA/BcrD ATPase family protein [Chromatiaceae bacterium AAb-1]